MLRINDNTAWTIDFDYVIESGVVSVHHTSFGTAETLICTGLDFGYHRIIFHSVSQKMEVTYTCRL